MVVFRDGDSIESSKYSVSMSELPLGQVKLSGESNEFIIIGRKKFFRDELMTAFGGNLNPGLSPKPWYEFANPVPLGLSAFSFTTFVLSMYNAQAMGIHVPNVIVAPACFYGGGIQLLAGIWDLMLGNTFGGTALSSYGAFWLSFAVIHIEAFGIANAYEGEEAMFKDAMAFFLLAWTLFTFMLVLCTTKSTVAFFSLFFSLFVTFLLLAIGEFTRNTGVTRAGGVVGIICSFLGWYNAFCGVATKQNSYIVGNPVPMPIFGTQK